MPSIKPQPPHMFVLGFGAYLPETDDYKLVRLVYHMNILLGYNGSLEIEIYSINSGVWRRVVGVKIKHCMVEVLWSRAFVNGVVHWIKYDVVPNGCGIRTLVMSFSIADALAGVTPTNLSIMLFEESLVVVNYEREIDGASCEVWVMKQYGVLESWSGLNNSDILFSTRRTDMVSYDPNSGRNTDLCIREISHFFYV
ncbi:hypothetical protein R3W88_001604 [Solanum pinnatisectum]|uniref:F-box associated beta-propeller type 1 domain-containing protein n=1 Tax=Solanum pinnatisectum TaxID=50273 RepID=A0AAV9MMI7_9SOLN|nr:hypothetical protein R3W88_001604 [Solanum pinnatisectum]